MASANLHHVLSLLLHHPYPHVPNPPSCKKRASVALILRVRPTYGNWPDLSSTSTPDTSAASASAAQRLDSFFSQSWVQNGDPEALFIKRASRVGDRWTGHVALPGGKRDPEDPDDRAAAIREAAEEIGLDLTGDNCIHVGNLPERVVTTSWGSIPLMVLCPFVFVLTDPVSPSLNLQPTEVASTHWVSLRALLSSSLRTVEYVDMAQRYANMGGFITRLAYRSVLGFMQFSAIRLVPSESLLCNTTAGFLPDETKSTPSLYQRWKSWCLSNQADSNDSNRPLLLWGLTLGILADFLDMLPPHTAVQLWEYPTFTPPDLRLIVNLITYRLRRRNAHQVRSGRRPSNTAMDSQTAALTVSPEMAKTQHQRNEVGIGGLGVGRYYGPFDRSPDGVSYAVGIMLQGYYNRLRLAVCVFLAWRIALGSVAGVYAWKLLRRR